MKRFKKALMILGAVIGIMATPLTVFAGSDNTPPTINAAVNSGILTINAFDESGIEVIYVNGFEYFDPKDGKLSIRLEKFEAGVQYFTISAMDRAGNKSEEQYLPNPYWTDPNADDGNGTSDNPADSLPASATATDPSSATGEVTEHDFYYLSNNPGYSREFYTIETESGKVFYLIIENEEDNRTVHFLTDINENDLLNTTENNSETLPKNSLGADSTIPATAVALPAEDGTVVEVSSNGERTVTDTSGTEIKETPTSTKPQTQTTTNPATVSDDKAEEEPEVKKSNPLLLYGGGGAILFLVLYYFKVVKKKNKTSEDFIEDEEEADIQESESYIEEDDEPVEEERGYFDRDQSDEDFFNDAEIDEEDN